ncbi:IS110 family transposase [Photobacterium aphoticum]|uniref:Transposase n=1 Tax=Photobacterium aphoticum TaxID=754436 RepID=A0A0J1GLC9_9GAMM|nr:IS110 family transposase [Photobacterium aphoticum]KLV00421.1 transposase [Photobacterium aphoticum]PSU59762.1 IS110 family transposase [Photobacterium aphoticum]GHA42533.1 IS110 family transposase [Photobacterium aphoticum]
MSLSIYGIDLAKHSFSIHGEDATGKVLIHKTISRSKVLATFANIPPALIGIEACGASHYWARKLTKLGHTVKIMASKYVAPFRTGAKNDLNDAAAICVAVTRPSTRFVKIKSAEQQAILMLHRARDNWVHERTALLNQIRAIMAEFGIITPKGRHALQSMIPLVLEDADNQLPDLARAIIADCYEHLCCINQRISDQEHFFDMLISRSHNAKKIMKVAGIGPITATAIIASVGKGEQFDKGRDFAAWLGLVPTQYSTGGKPRLSLWCKSLVERRGLKRAIVALAAKNARIVWSLLYHDTEYAPMNN